MRGAPGNPRRYKGKKANTIKLLFTLALHNPQRSTHTHSMGVWRETGKGPGSSVHGKETRREKTGITRPADTNRGKYNNPAENISLPPP